MLPVDWTPTHDLPPLEAILTTPNGLEIRPYTRGFGAMVEGAGDDPADRPHIGVALMQPRSRGRVRVVSDDPDVPPIIEHRYDSDPHDVATLSAGAELARELASSTTKVGQASWSTSQHLCGTAPMGLEGDAAAVVDEQCRVRGVDGLWVVDGSILPTVTSRGPHATIVMLGHRAAEFIVELTARAVSRRTNPSCCPSRPGDQTATKAAATASSIARRNSDRSIASRKADLGELASAAPCGPICSAMASALASESSARREPVRGSRRGSGARTLGVLRGEHRSGDRDTDRGADFPGRVVDRRGDALLFVGDGVHDRGRRWRRAQAAHRRRRPSTTRTGRTSTRRPGWRRYPDQTGRGCRPCRRSLSVGTTFETNSLGSRPTVLFPQRKVA